MTELWKLTNQKSQTRGATQWGPGITHTANGQGELCGPGWLHAYTDPLLAIFLNPIHANIAKPRLWRCEGTVGATDHGLKVGTSSLTTLEEVPLPKMTTEQRVRFAILCAKRVCTDPDWNHWADAWLDGTARSAEAAWAAKDAAAEAAMEAAAQAARAAAWAAMAAMEAEAARAAEADLDLIAIAHEAVS